MATPPQVDERLEKVQTVVIPWDTYKKTLRRNYLDPDYTDRYHDRSFVLRLYPPFEAEMTVEYYESMQGRHYDNNWSEKPLHIRPEIILLEGCDGNPFRWVAWPTEANTKAELPDNERETISDEQLQEYVDEGREIFWDELKADLPETFDLGCVHGVGSYPVELRWENVE